MLFIVVFKEFVCDIKENNNKASKEEIEMKENDSSKEVMRDKDECERCSSKDTT